MRPVFYLILMLFSANVLRGQPEASKEAQQSLYYTDSIYSENLEEYRKHNVYLPEGFNKQKEYPIIYATDGEVNLTGSVIKATLDSLIQNKVIGPVIYIGSHANTKTIGDAVVDASTGMSISMQYRNFEYVPSPGAEQYMPEIKGRFENHMHYFTNELIPRVEASLGQQGIRARRYFYGTSNGAGFGANLLNADPDLIGTYICYSTLGSFATQNTWDTATLYPDLILKYGDQEGEAFKQEAESLQNNYLKTGSSCDLEVFSGGHEERLWNKEFAKTLPELFGVN